MASVIIVVIGPHWLTASDSSGVRRIDDPNDFVALEIASALTRSALVIPVPVDGASKRPRNPKYAFPPVQIEKHFFHCTYVDAIQRALGRKVIRTGS